MRVKFDNEKDSNLQLSKAGSLFMSTWKESARYQPCGTYETKNVLEILDSENGLLSWIEKS